MHESASDETLYPYLPYRFRPVRVQTMFGRTDNLTPAVDMKTTIWYFFRAPQPGHVGCLNHVRRDARGGRMGVAAY